MKIIKIGNCIECIYLKMTKESSLMWCKKFKKYIKYEDLPYPDWCKLENYKKNTSRRVRMEHFGPKTRPTD